MKVLLANEYGFCFGVERAVEMVEAAIGDGDRVRTLGPLIHNEQEMQRLAHEGVTTISDPVQIKRGETAVIRAHGVTPEVQKAWKTWPQRLLTPPVRLSLVSKSWRRAR